MTRPIEEDSQSDAVLRAYPSLQRLVAKDFVSTEAAHKLVEVVHANNLAFGKGRGSDIYTNGRHFISQTVYQVTPHPQSDTLEDRKVSTLAVVKYYPDNKDIQIENGIGQIVEQPQIPEEVFDFIMQGFSQQRSIASDFQWALTGIGKNIRPENLREKRTKAVEDEIKKLRKLIGRQYDKPLQYEDIQQIIQSLFPVLSALPKKFGAIERDITFEEGVGKIAEVEIRDENGFVWRMTSSTNLSSAQEYSNGEERVTLYKYSPGTRVKDPQPPRCHSYAQVVVKKGKYPYQIIQHGYFAWPKRSEAFSHSSDNTKGAYQHTLQLLSEIRKLGKNKDV